MALTLELAVPLIRHPSEVFLSQLEEDAVKLIMQHDKKVVSACLSLLGSVVNNVTKVTYTQVPSLMMEFIVLTFKLLIFIHFHHKITRFQHYYREIQ